MPQKKATPFLRLKRQLFEFRSPKPFELPQINPVLMLKEDLQKSMAQIFARHEAATPYDKQCQFSSEIFFAGEDIEERLFIAPFVCRSWMTHEDNKAFLVEIILYGEAVNMSEITRDAVLNLAVVEKNLKQNRIYCDLILEEDVVPCIPDFSMGAMDLRLMSPTRIREDGEIVDQMMPFDYLHKQLTQRLNHLSMIYEGAPLPDHLYGDSEGFGWIQSFPKELKFKAEHVAAPNHPDNLRAGLRGSMNYCGALDEYGELLAWLPWIHLGENTQFGYGWCRFDAPQTH